MKVKKEEGSKVLNVQSLVVLEDLTLVVPSLVVPIEPPNFTAATIIKKGSFYLSTLGCSAFMGSF